MKIIKAQIFKLYLPLKKPFRTGFGIITHREIVFVKLFDKSGLIGVGESANMDIPLYEPEFNDSSILILKNFIIPRLLNKKIATIDDLGKIYQPLRGNNFAKVATESAFWHLKSQQTNKPLRKLWGGTKTAIPVAISIGLGRNLKETINRVLRYIDIYQPKRAKIKIKPGIDIQLVDAIRRQYPNLLLMVDANSSYTLKDLKTFKQLDQYNLLMIEQPLAYNDLVDHSTLQKSLITPICLDESINSYHAAEQAIKINACKIINIKPQRVGGYWQAKRISQLAQKHHIPVWCGGMIESGWGQLFNCHLASLPNFQYDNDICLTQWYLADDIIEQSIPETAGKINLSATDDLFHINSRKFNQYTFTKITVR